MTDLRILRDDAWRPWLESTEPAFSGAGGTAEHRTFRDSVTELERRMGLWDGDQCVGTAGSFSFRLSVPGGGLVPAAGVSMVSVAATPRRHGLLTTMMRRQLDDVRDRGEPIPH
jgi:predicted acetyltransferase